MINLYVQGICLQVSKSAWWKVKQLWLCISHLHCTTIVQDKCVSELRVLIFVVFTSWMYLLTWDSCSVLSSELYNWSCGSLWLDSCLTPTHRFHSTWKLVLPVVNGALDRILLYHSLSKYKKLILAKQEGWQVWIGFHSSWTKHWELIILWRQDR